MLEVALDIIPLPILSCEEGLLSGMLMANQNLLKVVQAQEKKMKCRYQSNQGDKPDIEIQQK